LYNFVVAGSELLWTSGSCYILREYRFVAVRSEITESQIGRTPCSDEICGMSNSQNVLSVYGAQCQRRGMYEHIRNSLNSGFLHATLPCKSSAPPHVMINVNWFHILVSLRVEMLVWISVSRHLAVMAWHPYDWRGPVVCLYLLVRFGSVLPGDGVGFLLISLAMTYRGWYRG